MQLPRQSHTILVSPTRSTRVNLRCFQRAHSERRAISTRHQHQSDAATEKYERRWLGHSSSRIAAETEAPKIITIGAEVDAVSTVIRNRVALKGYSCIKRNGKTADDGGTAEVLSDKSVRNGKPASVV